MGVRGILHFNPDKQRRRQSKLCHGLWERRKARTSRWQPGLRSTLWRPSLQTKMALWRSGPFRPLTRHQRRAVDMESKQQTQGRDRGAWWKVMATRAEQGGGAEVLGEKAAVVAALTLQDIMLPRWLRAAVAQTRKQRPGWARRPRWPRPMRRCRGACMAPRPARRMAATMRSSSSRARRDQLPSRQRDLSLPTTYSVH